MGKIFQFRGAVLKYRLYKAARVMMGHKDAMGLTEMSDPLLQGLGLDLGMNPTQNLMRIRTHIWAYVGTSKIARTIAGLKLKFYKHNPDGTKEEIFDHRFIDLLNRPNNWMTHDNFYEFCMFHLLGTGSSFILMDTQAPNGTSIGLSGTGPTRLIPLMANEVEPIPDSQNFVSGFKYTTPGGGQVTYPAIQVLWIKTVDPLSYYNGLSPMTPARQLLTTDKAARERIEMYLTKGAEPGTLLMSDQPIDEDVDKRVRINWDKYHGGSRLAATLGILWGGLKKEKTTSPKDMDWSKLMEFNREETLGSFGIPPAIAGILRYANYANVDKQDEIFWTETIIPYKRKIEATFNEMFFPIWETGFKMTMEFDTSHIKVLQEDKEKQSKIDDTYVSGGIKTPNEVRETLGLEPHIDGDILRTRTVQIANSNDDNKSLIWNLKANKGATQRWQSRQDQMKSPAKSMTKLMSDYFLSIYPSIKSKAKSTKSTDNIDEIFVYHEEQPKLQKLLRPEIEDIIKLSGNSAFDDVLERGYKPETVKHHEIVEVAFDITDPLVVGWINSEAFVQSKLITEATIIGIRRVMTQAINEGWTIDEIARQFDVILGRSLDFRSVRIARTEINTAYNRGTMFGYEDAGVKEKTWLSARIVSGPGKSRDAHLAADGQTVLIGNPFIVMGEQLDYPGDPKGSAANIVNCRCVPDAVT